MKIFVSFFLVLNIMGCTRKKAELGTAENPIKFFLVPSSDTKMLVEQGEKVKGYLEKVTPYKYLVSVPATYIAVVEAFGTKRADVSGLNTFGYLLANERYGVEARITTVRYGSETYQAMIVVRADGGIKKVSDLKNKKFAFVDPASTSGYILPTKLLKDQNVKLKEHVFAQKHDNVIMMVYQGQVDAGAAFYSPPEKGRIQDARRLVKKQYPNVEEKIKILTLTDPVPNDPIVFRKDLSEEMKEKIVQALLQYMDTEDGKKVFYEIYGATSLARSNDRTYDSVREILKDLGKKASDFTK